MKGSGSVDSRGSTNTYAYARYSHTAISILSAAVVHIQCYKSRLALMFAPIGFVYDVHTVLMYITYILQLQLHCYDCAK